MATNYLISVVGPTAIGKTALAIEVAKHYDCPILSADSRQFFRELSIGTAKPSLEELDAAEHHFINNLSIADDYNASDFEKEAMVVLSRIYQTKNKAILCGGSGMYVDAVLKGFDSEVPTSDEKIRNELNQKLEKEGISALQEQLKKLDPTFYEEVDLSNSKRLMRAIEVCLLSGKKYSEIRKGKPKSRNFEVIKIGLNMPRELLYQRINSRVDKMLENGLLEEVSSVKQYQEKNALKTVGYRELIDFFEGRKTKEEAIEKIKVNSRRYAKRQLTWFKQDSEIEWFLPEQNAEIIKYIRRRIEKNESSQ